MTGAARIGVRGVALAVAGAALVTAVAHLPELLGVVDCDPMLAFGAIGLDPGAPHLLPGACDIDGNSGGTVQALGRLSARLWLHGQIPWWNHLAGIGLPLASEMQSISLFVPFVLLLALAHGMLALKMSLQLLAGTFAVLFLRRTGLGWFASSIGGAAYLLSSMFAWFDHAAMHPAAFLPLLLLGIEIGTDDCGSAAFACPLLVALAIALSLAAGFPETAFADGLLGLVWLAVRTAQAPAGRRVRLAARVVLGGCLGLMLAAPVLIPFLDDLDRSVTDMHRFAMASAALPDNAPSLLFPSIYGAPYAHEFRAWIGPFGFVGVAIALPALAGLVSRRPDAIGATLAAWIALCILGGWRIGRLGKALHHLPVVSLLDFSRYLAPSVSLAAIVLACRAIEDWRLGRRVRIAPALMLLGLGAALVLAAGRVRLQSDWQASGIVRATLLASLATGGVVAAAIAGLMGGPARPARAAMLGATILAASLASFMVPELAGSRGGTIDLALTRFLSRDLGLQRAYSMGDVLYPNDGSYFGFAQLDTNYEPVLSAWNLLVPSFDPMAFGENFAGTDGTAATRGADLIERRAAFADAAVRDVVIGTADDPFARSVPAPLRLVYADRLARIYRLAGARDYLETFGGPCRLEVESRDRQVARCEAPARLVRRELAVAGWHVAIDGRKGAILPEGMAFQSVALPTGRADIAWRYVPAHARAILALFGAGVAGVLLLGGGAVSRRRSRLPRATPDERR